MFIPYMIYYSEPLSTVFDTVSMYAWINQAGNQGIPSWLLRRDYEWYYYLKSYLKSLRNGLETMCCFHAENPFYLSYRLENIVLSASYHGIGLSMDDNGLCCPGSRYLWFALGKINVSISVLERSNGFVGQVLVFYAQMRQ